MAGHGECGGIFGCPQELQQGAEHLEVVGLELADVELPEGPLLVQHAPLEFPTRHLPAVAAEGRHLSFERLLHLAPQPLQALQQFFIAPGPELQVGHHLLGPQLGQLGRHFGPQALKQVPQCQHRHPQNLFLLRAACNLPEGLGHTQPPHPLDRRGQVRQQPTRENRFVQRLRAGRRVLEHGGQEMQALRLHEQLAGSPRSEHFGKAVEGRRDTPRRVRGAPQLPADEV
mmetsp:Transcript_9812/g.27561  ORF Transcript_9812/g.27561 Transcript_9812/m.27561 type:complete len:229 (+) Transcript_9812:1061-1747(+)